MNTAKTGFSAYEEIQALAKRAFPTRSVSVVASIFGDEYNVKVDGRELWTGNTESVRAKLNQALALLDKEVRS